jgi:hypothetical protein
MHIAYAQTSIQPLRMGAEVHCAVLAWQKLPFMGTNKGESWPQFCYRICTSNLFGRES